MLDVINQLDGLWSAISAICTAIAVLVAIWATRKVLEVERKSTLKDELRSVREALTTMVATRGDLEGGLQPYWKVVGQYRSASEDPFSDASVQQESRVHETVYKIEAASVALTTSLRGAVSLAPTAWDESEVDRLVAFIEVHGAKGWMPAYLTLVGSGAGKPVTGDDLAREVVGNGSVDMDFFAASWFVSAQNAGFPGDHADARAAVDFYHDGGRVLREAVAAFLAVGDRISRSKRDLSTASPSRFLQRTTGRQAGSDLLRPELEPYREEHVDGRVELRATSGQVYEGDSFADLIGQIWSADEYRDVQVNEPLALAWRQTSLYRLARKHNAAILEKVAAGDLVVGDGERALLDALATGVEPAERPYAAWTRAGQPIAVVKGWIDAPEGSRTIVLDPATERSLLQSLGTLRFTSEAAQPPYRVPSGRVRAR